MYHRNYTTYLHKELDFLKLLVSRFHEQEYVNDLELGIAMQKSQEIYEYFLRMKLFPELKKEATPIIAHPQPEYIPVPEPKRTYAPEPAPVRVSVPEPVYEPEPVYTPEPEPVYEYEPVYEPEPEPVYVPEPQPVRAPEPKPVISIRDDFSDDKRSKKPVKAKPEPAKAAILADKLTPTDFVPINETLAQKNVGTDLSSKLQTAPIASIASGIGLNDRFLYVRELFKGDSNKYNRALKHLDTVDTLEEALDFITCHFDWNPKSEATQKFLKLVHRRHGG